MSSQPLFVDRVMETSTTTSTGTYTLAGAVTGFQSFAGVGDGKSCYYCACDVDGNGNPSGGWEVGRGTYTASGTTLTRDSVLASSNSGSAVSWSAGTRRVFVVVPATRVDPIAVTKTATTYTATVEDDVILCDCTSNAITVTLPSAAARGSNPLRIKKIDSTANAVTISRAGSDLIDGATSQTLNAQYAAMTLHSDGSANFYVF